MGNSISDVQLKTLNALRCVRLSEDDGNIRDVEFFINSRNPYLEDVLKGDAFEEDMKGSNAFYVVKSPEDLILCYFSLKSGLLYNKHGDLEMLQSKKKLKLLLNERDALNQTDSRLKEDIQNAIEETKEKLKRWMELDADDEVHKRVAKTFPAVEIAHFCINQNAKDYWKKLDLGEKNRIGVTIFWHFIVPHST